MNEKKASLQRNFRYLYQPGEREGGPKRATDPIWSLKVYPLERAVTKPYEPVIYHLHDGPKCGFVREELLVTRQAHSFRLLMSCETRAARCESHPAAPSVYLNTHSALASAAHKWPSLR